MQTLYWRSVLNRAKSGPKVANGAGLSYHGCPLKVLLRTVPWGSAAPISLCDANVDREVHMLFVALGSVEGPVAGAVAVRSGDGS